MTVKILIFSDSHASLRFMRRCVDKIKPQALVHLGDYYDDGQTIAEEYPQIPMWQVAGNCDKYRAPVSARQMLCVALGGVRVYMTHGHNERVKSGIGGLLAEARRGDARVALYGHTHMPDCHREADGLWVLNPGSAGSSAGVLEIENGQVTDCRLINESEDIV